MKLRHIIILLFLFCLASNLSAQSPWNALGDTLTVIMTPILNVPAIHIPGETLHITCIAPPNTTGWQAELIHGSKTVPLNIHSAEYVTTPNRWLLQANIPNVPVFELYSLRVRANGGIDDTTANAVHLVPSRKQNYYFVHITDTHMPTRIYYPNAGYATDSLAVNDFRAVMDDINLIRPEFVLLTGDIINEGELENFAGQFWYGWIQRVLTQMEVPFFLTNGNHDIGGWNATPAPQGSARRNWWRYFGWPWLNSADSNWGMFTQDYSFTYGDVHYIGMEAYDNYDNWRANIYGGQSFIYSQLTWLNQQMLLHPDKTRVLFYHYDFSDQINLSALGADMGLWGHIHSNNGSLSTYPYNLATRSTCDGNRAYRVVRVNGSSLQPLSTIYAGSSGNNINVNFYPSNSAAADSVLAIFTNNQNITFENSLLKFNMPAGIWDYVVYNGVIEQVDRGAQRNVVYVRVNLTNNSVKYVSVASRPGSSIPDDTLMPTLPGIGKVYPNPFSGSVSIELERAGKQRHSVNVYDLRGRLIRRLSTDNASEPAILRWDGLDAQGMPTPAGVYFLRLEGSSAAIKRVIRVRG